MFGWVARWLTNSQSIHMRKHVTSNTSDLVHLIDRFLDDELNFPLEWDDFVSWEQENLSVEEARKKIAPLEPLFMSKSDIDKQRAILLLIEERNLLAALCGIPFRDGLN